MYYLREILFNSGVLDTFRPVDLYMKVEFFFLRYYSSALFKKLSMHSTEIARLVHIRPYNALAFYGPIASAL